MYDHKIEGLGRDDALPYPFMRTVHDEPNVVARHPGKRAGHALFAEIDEVVVEPG